MVYNNMVYNAFQHTLHTNRSLSTRFVSNFSLPLELIAPACDMTIYCIQQQCEKEDDARKAATVWGTEILISCGEYLRNHLRKSVFLFIFL